MKTGQIVCSESGRDKGSFMAVYGVQNNYVLLCDGKARPVDRPKRKSMKHISVTDHCLTADELSGNKALRRALSAYRAQSQPKEGF